METRTRLFFKMAIIAVLCFVSTVMYGQQIQINDEAGLRAIANDLAGDYVLTADITLTGDWIPIGDDDNRFTGVIDGNGKTIYGLNFRNSSLNGAGFIGVANGATIKNLSIVGAQVYGGQDVGIIIGRAYAPTLVEKCYTSGAVSGYDHVGGFIGGTKKSDPEGERNSIKNCYSTAMVLSTSWQAGGILGTSVDTEISNTYFGGVASCPSGRTGGIVALGDGGSTVIKNSVVMAAYLKGDETNRILGSENNTNVTLEKNYSWENTEVYVKGEPSDDGESDPNGKDGEHVTAAKLKTASFYKTDLSWNDPVWKIEDGNYPIFSHQSYPIDADGIYIPSFPERPLPGDKFDAGALSALNRTVSYSSSDPAVASVDASGMVSFIKDGTTTLTFSTQGDTYSKGATVKILLTVQGISYQIRTEEDLRNIKYDLEGEFTLMNDITLTKDWELMGTFKGKLNGNGKIIYGLRYDNRNQYGVGLFGSAEGATITKLGIEKAYIIGNGDVGAIVGNAYGCIISECYVANSYISGRDHVAAIVGAMRTYSKGEGDAKETIYTKVRNCHSGAHIYSREYQAGGIVGIICGGTLEKCYFSGFVQSQSGRATGIAAMVDSNDPGIITNNINLAAAVYCGENYRIADWGSRGPESGNYVVEFINNWSVEQSYFGTSLKFSSVKENHNENDRDGRNLSNDNLARTQSFYTGTLGWDFNDTWKFMPGTEGLMYPVLKWQEASLVSVIYGIPDPAYLIWTPGAEDNIHLGKIKGSYGQTLDFEILEGGEFVERDGNLLYISEKEPGKEGWTKVKLNMNSALNNIIDPQKTQMDIEILLNGTIYDITSVQDFLNINKKPFAKYRLTKTIDMKGVEFEGIGSAQSPFTGQLNGNGNSILNVTVITKGADKKGLFNATDGARIEKLGVENFSFSGSTTSGSGSADLGGIAGSCRNTVIDQCYISGHIIGRDHVGGFVGGDCDNVTIRNSYADVRIEAGTQAGGFFGVTAGSVTVENSYFVGSVTTNSAWAGGIIGLIDRTGTIKISNTVSIGNVSSGDRAGNFIGGNMEDNGVPRGAIDLFLKNLYNYDAIIKTNGQEWSVPQEITGQVEYPAGKGVSDLKSKATYTAIGWDFATIWGIEEGQAYPRLNVLHTSLYPETQDVNAYKVYTSDNNIHISGIGQSAIVTLYNINGQMLSQSNVSDEAVLSVPGKGFYIVNIVEGGKITPVKVIVK